MRQLTTEQARELAAKSRAAHKANWVRLQQEAAIGRALSAKANELVSTPAAAVATTDAAANDYLSSRLMRVREQIASLEERLTSLLVDGDPVEAASAIDRLCAAKAKLSEEERILAGRPLPGSHRPRQTSGPRRPSAADPLAE